VRIRQSKSLRLSALRTSHSPQGFSPSPESAPGAPAAAVLCVPRQLGDSRSLIVQAHCFYSCMPIPSMCMQYWAAGRLRLVGDPQASSRQRSRPFSRVIAQEAPDSWDSDLWPDSLLGSAITRTRADHLRGCGNWSYTMTRARELAVRVHALPCRQARPAIRSGSCVEPTLPVLTYPRTLRYGSRRALLAAASGSSKRLAGRAF
jgi:hypothetical protein